MTLVLADGQPVSLRGVDLALIPQLLVRAEETVLVGHVWHEASIPHMQALLDHVHKAKLAQNVNFRVETVRIYPGAPAWPVDTPTPTPGLAGSGVVAATPTPSPTSAHNPPPPNAVADAVVDFVKTTVTKSFRAIVIGVGNNQAGKLLYIGETVKSLLATTEASLKVPLWAMKPLGSGIRANHGARFMVVIHNEECISALEYIVTIADAAKRGDQVSCVFLSSTKPLEEGEEPIPLEEIKAKCVKTLNAAGFFDPKDTAAEEEEGQPAADAAAATVALTSQLSVDQKLDNAGMAAAKFTQGMRCDFMVVACGMGPKWDNFTNVCLGAPKPHCILVPK